MYQNIPNIVTYIWYFGKDVPSFCLHNLMHNVAEIKNNRANVRGKVYLYTNKPHKMKAILQTQYPTLLKNLQIKNVAELILHYQQKHKQWLKDLKIDFLLNYSRVNIEPDAIKTLIKNNIPFTWTTDLLQKILLLETNGSANYAFIVDILRLLALIKHGGLYSDIDNLLLRYDEFGAPSYGVVLQSFYSKSQHRRILKFNNNLIAATPDNIYIKTMLFNIMAHFLWLSDLPDKQHISPCLTPLLSKQWMKMSEPKITAPALPPPPCVMTKLEQIRGISITQDSDSSTVVSSCPTGLPSIPGDDDREIAPRVTTPVPSYEKSRSDLRRNIGNYRWNCEIYFAGPGAVGSLAKFQNSLVLHSDKHDQFDFFADNEMGKDIYPLPPLLATQCQQLKTAIKGKTIYTAYKGLRFMVAHMLSWEAVKHAPYEATF